MRSRLILIIALTLISKAITFASDTISLTRVEPSSWWTGMKNPDLQVLVYGKNISFTDVKISIPGVKLKGVTRVENKNYLFINLEITSNAQAGTYQLGFFKNNKQLVRTAFTLFNRRSGSGLRKGYDASDVIYLLMPDRFSNGDTTNDASPDTYEKPNRMDPDGRHGGDIQGIINHLDYLKDLGITALWSTPLMEDNMEKTSYHTYAITDYYRIDPRYGTNEDYKRLSSELHKRNMKLIMDVVTNHCGLNYYWIKDLPTQDWIHQFREFTRSNYRISTIYDPYASEFDKNKNLNGWFDYSMPDLNQDNPLVLTYLTQNTIWWIEYANLDGLRVDTYPYNSPKKISQWTQAIINEYPNINIVGEVTVHTTQEAAYWQAGAKNFDGYDSHLPTVMDFPLNDVFQNAFQEPDGWDAGVTKFYNHFTLDYAFTNTSNVLIFTENHDTKRFNEIINGDINKFKIAYTILFTIRGIPQFYYGSEIMMRGDKDKGDGDIRRDFPGGWPQDKRNAFEKNGRTPLENEAFDFIQKLLKWRQVNPVIYKGKTMQYVPENNCYVYFRKDKTKTLMVIINNKDNRELKLNTVRFAEIMKGFTSAYDVISGENFNNLAEIDVPAKTSMILELK